MNQAQLTGLKLMKLHLEPLDKNDNEWEVVKKGAFGPGRDHLIAFGLTRQRAEQWAAVIPGATIQHCMD